MGWKLKLIVFFMCCILMSCQSKYHQDTYPILGTHTLEEYDIIQKVDGTYRLYIRETKQNRSDRMDYNPYHLQAPILKSSEIDINGNGKKELLVMVRKRTRYDTVIRNRLFVFKAYRNCVRPLWLGSRLGGDLLDYKCIKKQNKTYIRALEKRNQLFFVADYIWNTFGFRFVDYKIKDTSKNIALKYFNND